MILILMTTKILPKNATVVYQDMSSTYMVQYLILNKYLSIIVVTGASIHAPRQMNSMYVHMFRRYIYKTRLPEHPHSPIC